MTRSTTRLAPRALAAAALLALSALSTAALAQVPGVYRGTTSQGQAIEVTLIDDGAGGVNFGGVLAFWKATCRTSGPGRDVAWGVGTDVPLVGGNQLDWEFKANSLYERIRFSVSGTSMTGFFGGRTPEFVNVNTSTTRVELCESGVLTFNAVLDTAPTAAGVPARPALGAHKLR